MQHRIIVMGVSGCGKSTIGQALAEKFDATFYDGDDYHPQSNIDKMASGTPLNDNDRRPWLEELAGILKDSESDCVLACSALKQHYRDILRTAGDVTFVHLEGSKETLLERLKDRSNNTDHFMPSSLIDSQLTTLESPDDEPDTITVSIDSPIPTILENVISRL